ncbi:MAG: hypothetical protein UR53_C0001G0161 [Candidatus Magasanikbacteria bacterium GW2011_GWC2_34_16]|uniref:Uncharacterized protein n=2 Tax=Candidatus Magasanikiibacteriota TaxID=1752731 RepID=A0A0G0JU42_9BACT|nr:MAG: hypothetical protein UR53_C0001G0161 [Candidatus Magasanikbacteria bacterium GW2011_GWC2_34_16]KKQ40474.1 MAG: hypothetical protein US58_C0020G0015 [Candidatus Magasanikbacteria bacterium GW2011_GWA2_37_8]
MNSHLFLSYFPKISFPRYKKLQARFLNLEEIWQVEAPELIAAGWEQNTATDFITWRETKPEEKILSDLEKTKIKTVCLNDPEYPALLKEINDPPLVLFYRGELPNSKQVAVAVVGTRRCTNYGKQVCQEIVEGLATQGILIVSGLALGIDGIAHEATLKMKGKTIAVLGSSVESSNIYPPSHRGLAEKIIANGGTVISEYPPGFTPTKYSFPMRNRIIAGLTLGSLIIEAPIKSGSLITARAALDYNRDVFAVPHPINSTMGTGNNNLLKLGAKCITSADDIIEALNLSGLTQLAIPLIPKADTANEADIIKTLSREPKSIDNIIKESGLDSPTTMSTLTLLEMKGYIRNLGGMMYILKN